MFGGYDDQDQSEFYNGASWSNGPNSGTTRAYGGSAGTQNAGIIYGGNSNISMRDYLKEILLKEGKKCECIRCREIKNKKLEINNIKLVIRKYNDNNADEYFISYESKDESIIYGFCRLRLNKTNKDIYFKELINCALVRELHVYGIMVPHNSSKSKTQHYGFGKKLLNVAEKISRVNTFNKIAIIAGIGVREYYKKLGYDLLNSYMIKDI